MAALLAACGGGDDDATTAVQEGPAGHHWSVGDDNAWPTPTGEARLHSPHRVRVSGHGQGLGYFAERNLDVALEKQANWPATATT
ncbi:MAG: hypothetical protein ACRD1K_11265 [Acidimicrobiales bacterium]